MLCCRGWYITRSLQIFFLSFPSRFRVSPLPKEQNCLLRGCMCSAATPVSSTRTPQRYYLVFVFLQSRSSHIHPVIVLLCLLCFLRFPSSHTYTPTSFSLLRCFCDSSAPIFLAPVFFFLGAAAGTPRRSSRLPLHPQDVHADPGRVLLQGHLRRRLFPGPLHPRLRRL